MASERTTTYSADLVDLYVGNALINSGYADGDFVSIEMESNDFGDKAGADGEVARFRTNDKRATIKIMLMQTSLGNNVLNTMRDLGLLSENGADVSAFEVRDRSSGVTLAKAPKVWVQKAPPGARGREVKDVEWALRAGHMKLDLSGTPST